MPNLPAGCEYPNCPCTYPDCFTKDERREWRESKREMDYLDQSVQDYHEWRNRD